MKPTPRFSDDPGFRYLAAQTRVAITLLHFYPPRMGVPANDA